MPKLITPGWSGGPLHISVGRWFLTQNGVNGTGVGEGIGVGEANTIGAEVAASVGIGVTRNGFRGIGGK